MVRIGICRQLHAFQHYRLWQTFLNELGFEVVLSPKTTRATVELGVRIAPAELCLPVKTFLGHVQQLAEMVDIIFLPRLVCYRLGNDWFYGCPKALALPDMTRALFPGMKSVELTIDERRWSREDAFRRLAVELHAKGPWPLALKKAQHAATEADELTQASGSPLHLFQDGPPAEKQSGSVANGRPRIGLIGHQYLLFDDALALGILDRLRRCGAEPVVLFSSPSQLADEARLATHPNWFYELELLWAGQTMVQQRSVDGILLVSSFACGTAPVTNEIIRREVEKGTNIPTLTLLFDEHTAEAGLLTRLESFVDLLMVKRAD
ncbi:MAG: acyl-CoA dehydratase activase-related protein [candidate division WOR-3 bacterium]